MFRSKKPDEKKDEKKAKDAENNEKLVQIAVKFLANPKVESASEETKKAFLKKKGLSDENIKKAFELYAESKKKPVEQPISSPSQGKSEDLPAQVAAPVVKSESVEDKIEAAKKNNFLSFKQMNLVALSPAVFSLEKLQTLIVSFNQIATIPNEIRNLSNLRIFHAVGCNLRDEQIQQGLWELPGLVELNLAKNHIISIENAMNLKTLTRLDVSENQILEIPEAISNLSKLELFNFRNNNVSELPIALKELKSLKRLILSENNLNKKLEEELRTKGIAGLIKYVEESY